MVREINIEDLDGLLLLYTQLHDNPIPAKSDSLLSLYNGIVEDKNHHIIVAEQDGRIISSCVIIIVPNLTHRQRPYAIIENVVTDSAYRKKGFAFACLEFAKDIAIQHNCYKIMLLTGSKQIETLNFYQRAGYNKDDKIGFIQWLNP